MSQVKQPRMSRVGSNGTHPHRTRIHGFSRLLTETRHDQGDGFFALTRDSGPLENIARFSTNDAATFPRTFEWVDGMKAVWHFSPEEALLRCRIYRNGEEAPVLSAYTVRKSTDSGRILTVSCGLTRTLTGSRILGHFDITDVDEQSDPRFIDLYIDIAPWVDKELKRLADEGIIEEVVSG